MMSPEYSLKSSKNTIFNEHPVYADDADHAGGVAYLGN